MTNPTAPISNPAAITPGKLPDSELTPVKTPQGVLDGQPTAKDLLQLITDLQKQDLDAKTLGTVNQAVKKTIEGLIDKTV